MQENPFPSFEPPAWMAGSHRQTFGGVLMSAPAEGDATEKLTVPLEDGESLLLLRDAAAGPPRGRLLLLHGLGGCARSRHLRHLVRAATPRGWEVVRVNARGAGEGLLLSRRIPHAGRWPDVAAVLAASPWTEAARGTPCLAVGFSMGGALLLNHLGATGEASGIDAAIAFNPPTDLAWSLDELERPRNRPYHWYYTSALLLSMRRRARLYPDAWALPRWGRHASVRALDRAYVARDAGFETAEAYYEACSARRRLSGVRVRTWVVSALDDPFVPASMLHRDLDDAPGVRLVLLRTGGHLGYVGRRPGGLEFWSTRATLAAAEKFLAAAGTAPGPSPIW